MGSRTFHTADYVVFAITIVISLGIGFYYAVVKGRHRTVTAAEYLVGSRSIGVIPLAFSLVVSYESSIMMLGFPAEVYSHGFMFWILSFATLTVLFLGTRLITPLIHPLQVTTIFWYTGLSYNSPAVRYVCSAVSVLNIILYMGLALFGPAIALQAVTDFPMEWSLIVIAGASVIYTSSGGFRAVVWTDVFQTLIMVAGMLAVLIQGTIVVGGPSEVWRYGLEGGRLNFWNFDLDPKVRHTFWSLYIGGMLKSVMFVISQQSIQRVTAAKTTQQAISSWTELLVVICMCLFLAYSNSLAFDVIMTNIWILAAGIKMTAIVGPIFFITLSMAMYEGLVAFAYYSHIGCDPLANGDITNPNQIIPFVTMDLFGSWPGMPGLFIAALFSASLSTLSSLLSALAAITVDDYVVHIWPSTTEKAKVIIAKVSVFVYGCLAIAIAFAISKIRGTLSQIGFGLMAAFTGPVAGLILMAAFVPFVNYKGAIVGVITSCIITFWISIGSHLSTTLMKEPPLPPAPVDNCTVNNSTISPYNYTVFNLKRIEQFEHYEPQGLDKLYSISYIWLDGLAILIVFIVGCVTSLLTGPRKAEEVDPKYKVPIFDKLCCCLPDYILRPFRCGINYTKAKETEEDLHLNAVPL